MSYILPNFLHESVDSTVSINEPKYFKASKYVTKEGAQYKIVKYAKDVLVDDLVGTYGLLRSVIVNSDNNVVSFAPPKSMSCEKFMMMYPHKTSSIIAEDFIEGTMINVFYDSVWRISTRSTVDANVAFYNSNNNTVPVTNSVSSSESKNKEKSMTFNEMFFEACSANNFNIMSLNPDFCYSFVLQHPNNRIVVPVKSPQLYLVEVYQIVNGESVSVNVHIHNVRSHGQWSSTTVLFPERYEFTTYNELIDKFASPNTPYHIMGIVIKNKDTNQRTKIRNPIYEEIRHLRGNQPKLQYQYLTLRHSGKMNDYLKFYPEAKADFSVYRDQVHMFTNTLHQNYIACFIKKQKPLKEYSSQYKNHMFKLHELFLNDLREKKQFVTNTVTINYVNALHPSVMMHCLNYHLKKQNVDTIKSDV
jgi:hypothetical protein